MPDLDLARQLIRDGRLEDLELLYESVHDVLSQLIRTTFIPRPGCRFIVADFSAIEARVVAWLAGEQWRLDVFNTHGKIYEASASQMFKVPIEQITKGSPLRQRGKIAELALGYGGGPGALKAMDSKGELPEEELPELVSSWREANPAIVRFWRDMERAAKAAVSERTTIQVHHGIECSYEAGALFLRLPSGRRLCYIRPKLEPDPKTGRKVLTYEGAEQGRWGRVRTYGGKLVENVTQAVARDCLAVAMLRLDYQGYDIVMHVHDEAVAEVPIGVSSADEVAEIMGQPIDWAPGLPLRADAYECDYYKKD
jgi:DNA polymerase